VHMVRDGESKQGKGKYQGNGCGWFCQAIGHESCAPKQQSQGSERRSTLLLMGILVPLLANVRDDRVSLPALPINPAERITLILNSVHRKSFSPCSSGPSAWIVRISLCGSSVR
jgi:hypothetical protein